MDSAIYSAECIVAVTGVTAYLLFFLGRFLVRRRPGLRLAAPVGTALAVRILAAAGVAVTGVARELRGGDELGFLARAVELSETPVTADAWTAALTGDLHILLMGGLYGTLGTEAPELALRIPMIGLAVAGVMLLVAAVHDLAGARAATIAAWLLALEPANVFFSSMLHKEPVLMLAYGLAAYGGAWMWRRGAVAALAPMALACALAASVRPYASWLLIAACGAIAVHAAIRAARARAAERVPARPLQAAGLIAAVVVLVAVTAPAVVQGTSQESLTRLQNSQAANATDDSALALDPVDYSTRESVVLNLPDRIADIMLRPYPWELDNTSQQLGLLGTAIVWAALLMIAMRLWGARGEMAHRLGPLAYLAFFVLVTYSLSAGNAGTAFRYRTHVVGLLLALAAILWCVRRAAAIRAARPTAAPHTSGPGTPGLTPG